MSIFKRSSEVQQPSAEAAKASFAPPSSIATPGVVPPAAAPVYSTRPAESATGIEGAGSTVAERVRVAREAQRSVRERVRVGVQRARAATSTGQSVAPRAVQVVPPSTRRPPRYPSDPEVYAQQGLLNLAWRWQEAGAPIRAIHAYYDLLTRYPDTPAAAAAVADLVDLSEKLADDGQFHIALAIYDHLEHLA